MLPAQEAVIAWKEGSRYVAVLPERKGGFIFVEDLRPDEPMEYFGEEETVEQGSTAPAAAAESAAAGEMEPPAAFELGDDD